MAAAAGSASEGAALAAELASGERARAEAALGGLCAELRALGDGESSPLLTDYLQASPMCAELNQLWEGGHDAGEHARVQSLLLEVLAAVLAGRFERSARTVRTRHGVAGWILAEKLQALARNLTSERDHLLRVTLNVLAGICEQSLALASQLHRSFNFTHESLQKLPHRRLQGDKKDKSKDKAKDKSKDGKEEKDGKGGQPKEREEVRTCYMRFAMSFLKWRDVGLTAAVVGIRGFLGQLLVSLKDDTPHRVVSFLTDIAETVLRPRQIARHTKVYFFNSFALRHLCSLLNSQSEEVATCARDFLVEVCTNTFLFRAYNQGLLLDMALDLRPLGAPQQALVRAVLRSHPALQVLYFAKLTLGMQPRLAPQWFHNARFLVELLATDATQEAAGGSGGLRMAVDQALMGKDDVTPELRTTMLVQAIVPPVVKRTLLTQALMHQDPHVVFAALRLLSALLSRADATLRSPSRSSGAVQEEEKVAQERLQLQLEVQRCLPEMGTLLLLWQGLLKESESPSGGHAKAAKKTSKQDKKANKKGKHAPDEEQQEGGADEAEEEPDANLLEDAQIRQFLQVSADDVGVGLEASSIFCKWCEVTRQYCEVLPQSLLDVKFDWAKLLAPVSAALVQNDTSRVSDAMLRRVQEAALCADAAMRSSGRTQSIQLSKPQLGWIETLLRVRSSSLLKKAHGEDVGASVLHTCDGLLRARFRALAAFGAEEDAELSVWLAELRKLPACVPFFCHTLQAVASRPGAMAGLLQEALAASDRAAACGKGAAAPSLFVFAAARQLTLPLSHGLPPAAEIGGATLEAYRTTCAGFVKAVSAQLGMLLPQSAGQMLSIFARAGAWQADGTPADAEQVRRSMMADLERAAALNELKRPGEPLTGGKPKKAKTAASSTRSQVDSASLIEEALSTLLGSSDDEALPSKGVVAEADAAALLKLWKLVAKSVRAGSSRSHCGAYVLLDGLAACAGAADSKLFTCWYLLMLCELAPVVADASSQVFEYVLAHRFWLRLQAEDFECKLTIALATYTLSCLLEAKAAKSPTAGTRRACRDVLLPLWRRGAAACHEEVVQELRELLPQKLVRGEAALRALEEPDRAVAAKLAQVCVQHSMVDDLVTQHLPEAGAEAQMAVLGALLLAPEGTGSSVSPPFLQASTSTRAACVGLLVAAVVADTCRAAGSALRKVLAIDEAAVLDFALSAKLSQLWPKTGRGEKSARAPISHDLLPLLERACRCNVALRKDMMKRLNQQKCDASSMLHLATVLAPLEPRLPFLDAESMSEIDASGLVGRLPPLSQLQLLLDLHPSASLLTLLRQVAASGVERASVAGTASGHLQLQQSHELLLELELRQCGKKKKKKLEQALVGLMSSLKDRLGAAPSAEVMLGDVRRLCRALKALPLPSADTQSQLERYSSEVLEMKSPEATAMLLSGLLEKVEEAPEDWQLRLAAALLEQGEDGAVPYWLLAHAVRWWGYLDTTSDVAVAFLETVRKSYTASLSKADRLRRQLLIGQASGDAAAVTASATRKRASPWEYRRWCASLPPWGEAGAWSWVLDNQRLKTTLDDFYYDRPMADACPWAHHQQQQDDAAGGEAVGGHVQRGGSSSSTASASAVAYDVGYVVPFLAGQLRNLFAEHSDDTTESRQHVGPVLSAVMSSGSLELLLMACACSTGGIRGAALESLSIVLSLADLWQAVLLEEDERPDRGRKDNSSNKLKNPFRELPHLVWLLRFVRNNLDRPEEPDGVPPPLPALMASFLCASVNVLLHPQHFLYIKIGMYLLGNVRVDMADIPLFYKLLLSEEADSSHEARLWMLRVLRRALRCRQEASEDADDGVADDAPQQEDAVEDIAGDSLAGGARSTRKAMERRYVLPWLMSFADSRELGGFVLWHEAFLCLEAELVPSTVGGAAGKAALTAAASSARRFGVADWILSQASRSWPGAGWRQIRVKVLDALSRLLLGVVRTCLAASSSDPARQGGGRLAAAEQLALGAALDGIIRGWLLAVRDSHREDQEQVVADPPLEALWSCAVGLSELSKAKDSGSSFSTAAATATAAAAAVAAQVGGVIQRLAGLADAISSHAGPASRRLGSKADEPPDVAALVSVAVGQRAGAGLEAVFAHCLAALEASPLSTQLQLLAYHMRQRLGGGAAAMAPSEQCPEETSAEPRRRKKRRTSSADTATLVTVDGGRFGLPSGAEASLTQLRPALEVSAVRLAGRLLHCLRTRGGAEVGAESVAAAALSLVRLLVSLPLRPNAAWRVYVLCVAALLTLSPPSLARDLDVQALAALPSPEAALQVEAAANEEAGSHDAAPACREDDWLEASSQLLAVLLCRLSS
eukprot:TRINITY_DN57627_c0_g1_i1.p1 TRINITY_DN57627_c0_g1~~TRINITY_DN57627_c0_g1_i1.p1  ORF type:complete len:2328 (-),score=636.29 TRINITY_DN57627_c0_g1_i1:56-7039(-)